MLNEYLYSVGIHLRALIESGGRRKARVWSLERRVFYSRTPSLLTENKYQ